jgi:Rrf2 family protein
MKFNTKIRYGIRVLTEVALNTKKTGLLQKEIAEKQNLSIKYLDHIIPPLKIAGLLKNAGGKGSGYKLAKDIDDINMIMIFKAFDPEIISIHCVEDELTCEREKFCASSKFWSRFNDTVKKFLTDSTLKEIIEEEEIFRKQEEKTEMYFI